MQEQFENATVQFSASKDKLHEGRVQLEEKLEALQQKHTQIIQEHDMEKASL